MSSPRPIGAESLLVNPVDCLTCGACCKGRTKIRLNDDEAEFMQGAGTSLEPVAEAPRRVTFLTILGVRRPDDPLYVRGRCGHLEETPDGQVLCDDYAGRPRACQDFVVGGFVCRQMRVQAGVDTPDDLNRYLQATGEAPAPQLVPSGSRGLPVAA